MRKTVGIAIDDWKLPVFRRMLDEERYAYTVHPGLTPETTLIKVTTDFVHPLQKLIEKAQAECREKGKPS